MKAFQPQPKYVAPPTLRYHALQSKLYRTRARYPVVWAGRGSGKTEIARRKIIRHLGMRYPAVEAANETPRFFYALPTYGQARRVAWDQLCRLVPPEWHETKGRTFYNGAMMIRSRFGVELHLVGLDSPQRVEGNQWCGAVIDENSDQRPGIFARTIQPALTAFDGWCWRIGVPKRYGIGAEEFKKACDFALTATDPDFEAYTWWSETVVPSHKIDKIKEAIDERDFNEQYRASWEQVSGAIFYAFDDVANVSPAINYMPNQRIVVGSDFNVNPMCWVLSHIIDGRMYIFDELMIRNTNTEETLNILYARYGQHAFGWDFYGDASSKARRTSASQSDYIQIYNDERFLDKKVYYYDSNPHIADRFAACNAMLRNAKGTIRCLINPKCKRLIADLKHRSYKEGTKDPNDIGDVGHMSDGFGYIVYRRFPLLIEVGTAPTVVIV